MKRGLLLYVSSVLTFGLSLNVSMPCFAQQNTIILAAKSDAEFDAEEDINTTVWLATGGILGVVGNPSARCYCYWWSVYLPTYSVC